MTVTLLSAGRRSKLSSALRTTLSPEGFPTATTVAAFWYDLELNFGDLVTPALIRRAGLVPVSRVPESARVAGAGSIIEMLSPRFEGVLWGAGKMHADRDTPLPEATVLGVRGALTRDVMGLPSRTPLGDPGLLLASLLREGSPHRQDGPVGIVTHLAHRDHPDLLALARPGETVMISAGQTPERVAQQISRCRCVLTTSLHGLVFADGLGVPAVWGLPSGSLPGGEFKFHDYLSTVEDGDTTKRRLRVDGSLSVDRVVDHAQRACRARLDETLSSLHTTYQQFTDHCAAASEVVRWPLLPVHQFQRR